MKDLPVLLFHEKKNIAFEELVRKEAEKYMLSSSIKHGFMRAGRYGSRFLLFNLVGGIAGYAVGGDIDSAIEGVKQISLTTAPLFLISGGLIEYSKGRIHNINQVIDAKRQEVQLYLRSIERESPLLIDTIQSLISGG